MIFPQFYLESLTVSIDSNLGRLYLKQVLECGLFPYFRSLFTTISHPESLSFLSRISFSFPVPHPVSRTPYRKKWKKLALQLILLQSVDKKIG